MSYEKPTHLDLFSGNGGFSLAFEAEGFRTIGFSEIDPFASAVLRKRWPHVPNYGDIRSVRGVSADVVTGGFPCQPFSLAGKRRGTSDDRHLWPEMCRVISETRPAWVLGENVPGIIGMELDNVLSDLENLGYACWPVVVPAVAVDARHRRDRLWIIAYASGINRRIQQKRSSECENTPIATHDGEEELVANTKSQHRRLQLSARHQEKSSKPYGGSETLADSNSHEQHRRSGNVQMGRFRCQGEVKTDGFKGGIEWRPEPELGRVAHGIPNRAHRLKCLGNAIVPQVAQVFAKAIYQMLTQPKD